MSDCLHTWIFRGGLSVCLNCPAKVADDRGLPRGHFGINGEAMDASRVEKHFNCPECGQQIRLEWGNGPDRLVCWSGHDVGELGYAMPRKRAEAAIWRRQQAKEAGVNIFQTKLFPYIDGNRLVGREVPVTIKGIVTEQVASERGEQEEFVLYFTETKKGLILNKTNAKAIALVYGAETDDWVGKSVVLYAEFGNWFGKPTNAARIKVPGSSNGKPAASTPPPPPPEDYEEASREADVEAAADQRQMDLDKYGL